MSRKLFRPPLPAVALSLVVALALAACGQRGPLYLPDEDQAVQPANPAEADEPDDEDAPPQQG